MLKKTAGIEGITSYDVVFRIPCRDVCSRNVSELLEVELRHARDIMPDTSSLRKHLECFEALWIMDGFDESTAECRGFLKSLVSNMPTTHKVIITTRPDCLENIERINGIEDLYSVVSLSNFDEAQIKDVARNFLEHSKLEDFENFYAGLNTESKEFLTTPLNLNLCLQLWTRDSTILWGILTTHKLYEHIFEELIIGLVHRFEDKTTIIQDSDLKMSIEKWLKEGLCKVAAETIFKKRLFVNELEKQTLCECASNRLLIPSYCLSSFLETEELSIGFSYSFRHKIQKEVLASFYMHQCNEESFEQLVKNVKKVDASSLTAYDYQFENPLNFNDCAFLFQCCDREQFARSFNVLLKNISSLQTAECLLRVKETNQEYFNVLKRQLKLWDPPLNFSFSDTQNLVDIIEALAPDLKMLKINITAGSEFGNSYYDDFCDSLSMLKKKIALQIALSITRNGTQNFIRLIERLKKTNDHLLVTEIEADMDWNDPNWWRNGLNKMFALENLKNITFSSVEFRKNNQGLMSFLSLVKKSCSQSLMSWIAGPKSRECNIHISFMLKDGNPNEMLEMLLKLATLFEIVTMDLTVCEHACPNINIEKSLLEKFQKSIRVTRIKLIVGLIDKYNFYWQLLNCTNIEKVELFIYDLNYRPITEEKLKEFFDRWNYENVSNLKEVCFSLLPQHLEMLYNIIPVNVVDRTYVYFMFDDEIQLKYIPTYFKGKKFKALYFRNLDGISNSKIISSLRCLTESLLELV